MAKASLSTLKNKLDKLWSEYVRRKDAIDGIATCVTCGTQKHGMGANWGWQAIRDLRDLKHKTVKYSRTDYEQMIKDVQQKLSELN